MSTQTVRSFLRIVAVVTILVGGIGVRTGIIGAFAMSQIMQSVSEGVNMQHSVTSAGLFAIFTWLAVVAWGVGLYQLSPGIARHITSEPDVAVLSGRPAPRGGPVHE